MFNQKKCPKCGKKVNSKQNFCPYCGVRLDNSKDLGMLGKNDLVDKETFQNPFLESFGGGMLGKMIGGTIKMLEKEIQKDMKNIKKTPRTNMKLMINGKEIMFSQPQPVKKKQVIKKIPKNNFTDEQIKKFSEFQKQETKTSMKRFGDKIIYEIEMPEVKSLKDILINNLENSIEIKAIGKTKAYFKIIPINMPIIGQNLSHGKLILELLGN
jgi:hypothetical protein